MKKILILIIITLCPFMTVRAADGCDAEDFKRIQKEIENITFKYEYLEEGSYDLAENDISGKFKVTSPNMPESVIAYFYKEEGKGKIVDSTYWSALDGGVYTVRFSHIDCGSKVVKQMEVFIPIYKQYDNEDVWFDGTYENKLVKPETPQDTVNTNLVIVLVSIIVILLISIIIVVVKRRRRSFK